jgi:predicted nucleic-acid-binding protein
VLLEVEWVLRSSYRKSREDIHRFFQALLETENIVIEDQEAVQRALEWYRLGANFADSLRLAACGMAILYTFDRGFCKAFI